MKNTTETRALISRRIEVLSSVVLRLKDELREAEEEKRRLEDALSKDDLSVITLVARPSPHSMIGAVFNAIEKSPDKVWVIDEIIRATEGDEVEIDDTHRAKVRRRVYELEKRGLVTFVGRGRYTLRKG